jgi:fumarate hydratase class II
VTQSGPLWGEQTELVRSVQVSGEPMPSAVIRAAAEIKAVAAEANAAAGVIGSAEAEAIRSAADEVADGGHGEEFPIDRLQTGSATATHMNVNEVIASLAAARLGRAVDAHDAVNASQSSNDVMPSAVHVAALRSAADLIRALELLSHRLTAKADEFAEVVTIGRTHLMDAVPVTVGAEFAGWATQIAAAATRIARTLPEVAEIPLGGSAVGTGLNTPPGWRADVVGRLAERTGLDLRPADDGVAAQGSRDALVSLSGAVRAAALAAGKVADDLRLKASGPTAGFAEFRLPTLAAGSSIMPGKVNPVVPEIVAQTVAEVVGRDATVAWAAARGHLELQAMVPVLGHALLTATDLLAAAVRLLADRCVSGITVDVDRTRRLAEASPAVVTGLNRYLGYDEAAAVLAESQRSGAPIADVVRARGHVPGRLTESELARALDVDQLARPPR